MMVPDNATFYDWAHSLIIDFPGDDIPTLTDENEWQLWGNLLVEQDSFAIDGAPSTFAYEDKWQWARDIYSAMTNF